MKAILATALACVIANAWAGDISGARWQPHRGARLPAAAFFLDEGGHEVTLGQYLGDQPVVLVFGYFHCRGLCPQVYRGASEALSVQAAAHADFELIAVSIDPRDSAADARAARLAIDPAIRSRTHFLTARGDAAARLAHAAGFEYRFDPDSGQFAHPAGLVIIGGDGVIRSYLPGVRFDREQLAAALRPDGAGPSGASAAPLSMLCFHFDPATGRYSLAVGRLLALACLATIAALAWWLRRERRVRP